MVQNLPATWEAQVRPLGQEDPLEKENGYPLQYSCLKNAMDRGAWWARVHRKEFDMTEWLTLLSEHRFLESRDFLHFIHSKSSVFKTVAHKRHLIHMGLLRWLSGKESACRCRRHGFDPWVGKIPWGRKWQPTLVFLPEKNPMDRRAWRTSVHGVTKSWT